MSGEEVNPVFAAIARGCGGDDGKDSGCSWTVQGCAVVVVVALAFANYLW